ncbi:hypothetical protein AB0D49_10220 [Streptomyces sp. NPDC048290]|uniref:hypothetical protein n=1 Tax=Streptomyces sp. NPDC048290 TaxID=3155811 RepID=UPI00342002E6
MTRRIRLLVTLGAVLTAGLSAGGATWAGHGEPAEDRISYVIRETDENAVGTAADAYDDCPWWDGPGSATGPSGTPSEAPSEAPSDTPSDAPADVASTL